MARQIPLWTQTGIETRELMEYALHSWQKAVTKNLCNKKENNERNGEGKKYQTKSFFFLIVESKKKYR
jgi:predicted CoA-binding protein